MHGGFKFFGSIKEFERRHHEIWEWGTINNGNRTEWSPIRSSD